jgi:parvulin-like peptidyl-prolyl isomerase
VSPQSSKGGRQASGAGAGKEAAGAAPARRRGLLIFGLAFLVLFLIVAISEGIGDPSIPEGDVILVEEAPGDAGNISQEEFDRALKQAAAAAQQPKPPKPGDPQYEEMKESAINNLLEFVWLEGLAAEMDITVSDRKVGKEFKKLKNESFQSEKEYKEFLKEAGFSQADINRQVKLQVLSTEIQEDLKGRAPKPSSSEIENYYEAAKATQFTQPASRSIRQIKNKDRQKVKAAKEGLAKGNTAKDWERLAKKYSEDAATKENGGLQEGVTEGTLGEPLDKAVFNAPDGQVEGPLESQGSFYVFEVQNATAESTQPLGEVEAQIRSQLEQQAEGEYFNAFVNDFNQTWTGRTFCDEGYVTERCANFEGDGRPPTADPGCYEANPETEPEACPAPVFQLIPALPGSVTPLEPQGKPLAQRPRPMEEEEEEAGGAAGLPPGVVPPTGAPPAEGAPPPAGE